MANLDQIPPRFPSGARTQITGIADHHSHQNSATTTLHFTFLKDCRIIFSKCLYMVNFGFQASTSCSTCKTAKLYNAWFYHFKINTAAGWKLKKRTLRQFVNRRLVNCRLVNLITKRQFVNCQLVNYVGWSTSSRNTSFRQLGLFFKYSIFTVYLRNVIT